MYGALGSITFQIAGAPRSLRATHGEDYAEQKVVGGKPLLQATGDKLATIALEIFLHVSFAQVAASVAALKAATAAKTALPLVLGDGTHLGRFVIAALEVTPEAALGDGTLVAVSASLALTEYVAAAAPAATRRKPRPKTPPPAVAPASSVLDGFDYATGRWVSGGPRGSVLDGFDYSTGKWVNTTAPAPGATPVMASAAISAGAGAPSGVPLATALRMGG